ncbi:unnamed protein product [Ilex paraguariensis]|uniref:CASP-like protein n=1 Tax=Ilex paraguariensis TaxID=185542 RepID=A0ABC8TLY8_9AQUA
MLEAQSDVPLGSKLRVIMVVARVVTFVSAIIAFAVMKTNNATTNQYRLRYKDISSYRYALLTMVVGVAYSLLQIPFAIYYLITGKRLVNRYAFLQFDFYGDKVTLVILASGIGAVFGATTDLDRAYNAENFGDFFSMAYLSAGFLLIGTVSSGVSSVISSMTLSKRE